MLLRHGQHSAVGLSRTSCARESHGRGNQLLRRTRFLITAAATSVFIRSWQTVVAMEHSADRAAGRSSQHTSDSTSTGRERDPFHMRDLAASASTSCSQDGRVITAAPLVAPSYIFPPGSAHARRLGISGEAAARQRSISPIGRALQDGSPTKRLLVKQAVDSWEAMSSGSPKYSLPPALKPQEIPKTNFTRILRRKSPLDGIEEFREIGGAEADSAGSRAGAPQNVATRDMLTICKEGVVGAERAGNNFEAPKKIQIASEVPRAAVTSVVPPPVKDSYIAGDGSSSNELGCVGGMKEAASRTSLLSEGLHRKEKDSTRSTLSSAESESCPVIGPLLPSPLNAPAGTTGVSPGSTAPADAMGAGANAISNTFPIPPGGFHLAASAGSSTSKNALSTWPRPLAAWQQTGPLSRLMMGGGSFFLGGAALTGSRLVANMCQKILHQDGGAAALNSHQHLQDESPCPPMNPMRMPTTFDELMAYPLETAADGKSLQRGPVVLPNHVGVVMDGNGRWASARGLHRSMGHRKAEQNVRELIETAAKIGIRQITLFAFSSDNWKRPADEVGHLMTRFSAFLRDSELRDQLQKHKIKIRIVGDLSPAYEAPSLMSSQFLGTAASQMSSSDGSSDLLNSTSNDNKTAAAAAGDPDEEDIDPSGDPDEADRACAGAAGGSGGIPRPASHPGPLVQLVQPIQIPERTNSPDVGAELVTGSPSTISSVTLAAKMDSERESVVSGLSPSWQRVCNWRVQPLAMSGAGGGCPPGVAGTGNGSVLRPQLQLSQVLLQPQAQQTAAGGAALGRGGSAPAGTRHRSKERSPEGEHRSGPKVFPLSPNTSPGRESGTSSRSGGSGERDGSLHDSATNALSVPAKNLSGDSIDSLAIAAKARQTSTQYHHMVDGAEADQPLYASTSSFEHVDGGPGAAAPDHDSFAIFTPTATAPDPLGRSASSVGAGSAGGKSAAIDDHERKLLDKRLHQIQKDQQMGKQPRDAYNCQLSLSRSLRDTGGSLDASMVDVGADPSGTSVQALASSFGALSLAGATGDIMADAEVPGQSLLRRGGREATSGSTRKRDKMYRMADTEKQHMRELIAELHALTDDHKGMKLNILLSYSMAWELPEAFKRYHEYMMRNPTAEIDFETLLSMFAVPSEIDLLIRTGNQRRMSGFCCVQLHYGEMYFEEKYFPEYHKDDLVRALVYYNGEERRRGKTSQQLSPPSAQRKPASGADE